MKIQTSLITLLSLLIFNLTTSKGEIKMSTGETSKIILKGKLDNESFRSGGDNITAEVQNGVIIALFHKNVGNILVTITDSVNSTVYEATVNTSVQHQVLIPLSGLPSGKYSITLNNERGDMWGMFEI